MLELHQHQNALQRQQNHIMEMLATRQKKSNLPQQRIPIFDGDPIEYGAFVRAFENVIESKTSREAVLSRAVYQWGCQGTCSILPLPPT